MGNSPKNHFPPFSNQHVDKNCLLSGKLKLVLNGIQHLDKSFNVKLTLPCIANIELIAQSSLDQLQTIVGFSVDKLEQAKILITEAIINSVEYNSSEKNQIFIEFEFKKNELFMTIRDNGHGFTIPDISNPNLKNRIEHGEFRGWGLSIMKSLSDDFSIKSDENGTQIRIYLRLID